jgi:hypothetical protein
MSTGSGPPRPQGMHSGAPSFTCVHVSRCPCAGVCTAGVRLAAVQRRVVVARRPCMCGDGVLCCCAGVVLLMSWHWLVSCTHPRRPARVACESSLVLATVAPASALTPTLRVACVAGPEAHALGCRQVCIVVCSRVCVHRVSRSHAQLIAARRHALCRRVFMRRRYAPPAHTELTRWRRSVDAVAIFVCCCAFCGRQHGNVCGAAAVVLLPLSRCRCRCCASDGAAAAHGCGRR